MPSNRSAFASNGFFESLRLCLLVPLSQLLTGKKARLSKKTRTRTLMSSSKLVPTLFPLLREVRRGLGPDAGKLVAAHS